MKKIIIFLITLLAVLPRCVNAQETSFYEGEYIDNIWMNKVTPDGKIIYYQKARIFRETGSNKLAYCIEPFKMFNENDTYQSTILPDNLTPEQKEKISLLSYLGYGYKNRSDKIWYAVTQLLIWETAGPSGKYYFTDSLNGNRINTYQSQIDELNSAVEYYKNNLLTTKEYTIYLGEKIEVVDNNKYVGTYITGNNYTSFKGNKIIIENLPLGNHQIKVTKKEQLYNSPIIFYQSSSSQNILTQGNLEPQEIIINVNVKDTNVKISKIDYDTNSTTPSGNAKLENVKFEIYDNNMNKIKEIIIDKSLTTSIQGLPIGKYYIKEIEAGNGYEIDSNLHEFELSKDSPEITVIFNKSSSIASVGRDSFNCFVLNSFNALIIIFIS